ncbi:MAG: IS5 family transposase, partial [Rhodanobacteraceae bacterium]
MAPKQLTLATQADAGFALHRKPTRRDVFLAEMDQVVPWSALCALIEPHYPKVREDGAGRRPIGMERMLRIHFLQQWYALSDPGVEEALYDSEAMRRFVGIDLGREGAPDESTVLKFRHLLERHGLAKQILAEVNRYLVKHGMKLSRGTIVDATIIAA